MLLRCIHFQHIQFGEKDMLMRAFVIAIIAIAIIVGILAISLSRENLMRLAYLRDFFDAPLPILGFGALIKYLCTCHGNKE